jgi:hypothetical protein
MIVFALSFSLLNCNDNSGFYGFCSHTSDNKLHLIYLRTFKNRYYFSYNIYEKQSVQRTHSCSGIISEFKATGITGMIHSIYIDKDSADLHETTEIKLRIKVPDVLNKTKGTYFPVPEEFTITDANCITTSRVYSFDPICESVFHQGQKYVAVEKESLIKFKKQCLEWEQKHPNSICVPVIYQP